MVTRRFAAIPGERMSHAGLLCLEAQSKVKESSMAGPRRRRSPAPPIVYPNAAGIDIGSREHFVAVPPDRTSEPVRSFRTFTEDLEALATWLEACGIRSVAMESTGVYWIPVYELLERRGFEVCLVDTRAVRQVPGRKSDVLDCQWIQQLHGFGLLRASFRPDDRIVVLRSYTRQRDSLVQLASMQIQHMQKALDQMNLQLHHVISDLTGQTGMRIVRALVAGERDPHVLAQHRDPRCRATPAQIEASLRGNLREEHLFALRQALELYDVVQEKISACDTQIEEVLAVLAPQPTPGPVLPPARSRASKDQAFREEPVRERLFALTGGVDLTQIEGMGLSSALRLIAEIGTDMSRWPTEKNFASWMRLAPRTEITGGKPHDRRTPAGSPRAAQILRQAATTVRRSSTALGSFYRRMAARIGVGKAIVATAAKMARLIYVLLRDRRPYQPVSAADYDARHHKRISRSLQRRARELGFTLVRLEPKPVQEPVS
jgi:transposase